MSKEEKIRELLVIEEDKLWEETLRLVSRVLSITKGGDVIFKISESKLTNKEKIVLYLVGKKYLHEAGIKDEPYVTLDDLTKALRINRNATSARVSELVKESKIKAMERSKYQISYFNLTEYLENIISKYNLERGLKMNPNVTQSEEKQRRSEINELSLREFVHLTKANNHTENTAVIAFYILEKENIKSFNYKQILEKFDKAMFDKPTNILDILNKMIKRRLLEEGELVDKLKGYKLTKTGVNFVEKLLSNSKNN